MSLPDPAPRLPKLPFLVADAGLLVAAFLIAHYAPDPFARTPLILSVLCVLTGALLVALPFIADYARSQEETLDQRQRALETLAATVASTAEQVGIAATGFHQIAELAQRTLKHTEQLPQKLQEKIGEFNAQLAQVREDEHDELEKEVATLRASETEKLESIADQIHQAVAEFARLEATVNKHLTAARVELIERTNEALGRLAASTTAALSEAATAASQTLHDAQQNAAAELDRKLAATCAAHVARTIAEIDLHLAHSLIRPTPSSSAPDQPLPPAGNASARADAPPADHPLPDEPPPAHRAAEPSTPTIPSPPEASGADSISSPLSTPAPTSPPPPIASSLSAAPAAIAADPAPDTTPETAPPSSSPNAVPSPATAGAALDPQADAKSLRRRPVRKPKTEDPVLELDLTPAPRAEAAHSAPGDAAADIPPDGSAESAVSSDGATRLLVTAYIGIGNKLFLRGDGPGLSWDQGVPLHFVSIGKWRWETNNATSAIRGRLYKNDEVECTALGELLLEPGHQKEVSAQF